MLTCLLSPVSQTLRRTCSQSCRNISLSFNLAQMEKPSSQQPASSQEIEEDSEEKNSLSCRDYRYIFPEFLPDPKPEWRNHIREKLERRDMLSRREQIEIPGSYYLFFRSFFWKDGCFVKMRLVFRTRNAKWNIRIVVSEVRWSLEKVKDVKIKEPSFWWAVPLTFPK